MPAPLKPGEHIDGNWVPRPISEADYNRLSKDEQLVYARSLQAMREGRWKPERPPEKKPWRR